MRPASKRKVQRACPTGQGRPRKSNQMSLLLSIKGTRVRLGHVLSMVESIIQAVGDKAFPNTHHRIATHLERLGYLDIGPSLPWSVAINLQENTGMGLLANGSLALGDQLL